MTENERNVSFFLFVSSAFLTFAHTKTLNLNTEHMKPKIFLLLFCCLSQLCSAQQYDIEQLYQRLDDAIAHSDRFMQQREDNIKAQLVAIGPSTPLQKVYDTYLSVAEAYQYYQNDSAIAFLDKAIAVARRMKNRPDLEADCQALQAYQCSAGGSHAEAVRLLGLIENNIMGEKAKIDFFQACAHTYGELGFYSKLHDQSQAYYRLYDQYCDSLIQILPANDETSLKFKEQRFVNAGKLDKALNINDQRLQQCKPWTHAYGIAAYYRSIIYAKMNDKENKKRWLLVSSICDVENAVTDQASLWTLASILSEEGDVDRAYRYINFSWHASQKFGTKMRDWQISPVLGTIDSTYQAKIKQANKHLTLFAIALSLMAAMLFLLLYYANRQKKHVTAARNDLRNANSQLTELNRQLTELNGQLTTVNSKLNESNRVKEEYLGRFISLCSSYIDKSDHFRMKVNRLVKSKQYQELLDTTKDDTMKERDLDELYANFDSVFLSLFPNFVDDLNTLLKDECHIKLAENGRLTTTVRVFALIRLGVDDSTKIAEFLHYAVNTIYNYRAKLRNAALGNRNDFERKVKELGTIAENK